MQNKRLVTLNPGSNDLSVGEKNNTKKNHQKFKMGT